MSLTSVFLDLCFFRLFLPQVGKSCIYCKIPVNDGSVLIEQCTAPFHFHCARQSINQFPSKVETMQDERHAKFGTRAKLELEKTAAKRKAISVALLGTESA